MNRSMRTLSVPLALVLVLALAPACRTVPAERPAVREATSAPRAWTDAFVKECVLVADEITIEGPADLVDHAVLRADPDTGTYLTKTVSEGLLQQLSALPQSHIEVRGQLDAWSLAAFRKITVLQRPGEVPVTVSARGNAFWSDGTRERRQDQLVFRGERGK